MQRTMRRIARALAGPSAALVLLPVVAIGLALALAWNFGWIRPAAPRAVMPMRQSVYLWQRAWNEPVRTAVEQRAPQFGGGMVVLGAEIGWTDGAPTQVVVELDHALLARTALPTGLALRIGPCPKELLSEAATIEYIAKVARDMLASARSGGWEPTELQLDFDSATSRLDGYRRWIEVLSAEFKPLRLTITVLPTWMSSSAFGPLVRATDGFVLQVHSVEKASLEAAAPSLCDARSALSWVEHAAHFGVPFRVALPSYGYLAFLNNAGALTGLVAEGRPHGEADGARVREVRADPTAMATLVARWMQTRPAAMQGIVWYRLPVDGDRLNWSWPTLSRVVRGEVPMAQLVLVARAGAGALVEVVAENHGDLEAELPRAIDARWTGAAEIVGADALAGMEWQRDVRGDLHHEVRFTRAAALSEGRVQPGEARALGWIRLTHATEVELHALD